MNTSAEVAALLRLSRALVQRAAARGTPNEVHWAREVDQAEAALATHQQPTLTSAPAGPRCLCGGPLLTVKGRAICASGQHDG
ncbi:hypothetical protein [Hyalangium versicolor]|uniref:hypothetical protein n=1 Tax=Hyalangium versicolor TaxID=2861190 RepID=UPI001CCC8F54|nr:hypothetical protein [Hyalangium versicolor]